MKEGMIRPQLNSQLLTVTEIPPVSGSNILLQCSIAEHWLNSYLISQQCSFNLKHLPHFFSPPPFLLLVLSICCCHDYVLLDDETGALESRASAWLTPCLSPQPLLCSSPHHPFPFLSQGRKITCR